MRHRVREEVPCGPQPLGAQCAAWGREKRDLDSSQAAGHYPSSKSRGKNTLHPPPEANHDNTELVRKVNLTDKLKRPLGGGKAFQLCLQGA